MSSYRYLVIPDDIFFQNTTQQTISFSDIESLASLREIYHNSTRATLSNKDVLFVYPKSPAKSKIVDVDDLHKYGSLVRINSYRARTKSDKTE